MAHKFFLLLILITFSVNVFCQNKLKKNIAAWQKCVVNLETEGKVFSRFQVNQTLANLQEQGYSDAKLDSAERAITALSNCHTGTAIYVKDHNRRYLITAKHVLLDSSITRQRIYDQQTGLLNGNANAEGIYSRISVRTPLSYAKKNVINNRAVYNYVSSSNTLLPYIFVSDEANTDLAIISLQEKNYRLLDKLLQQNGYEPVSIEKICSKESLEVGDDIYTIGFPENISVVSKLNLPQSTPLYQLNQIISPFTSFGKVSMYNSSLNFFYADLTISFGNSGGPVIKNNRLMGIVSGVNKYSILSDAQKPSGADHYYGVGHLVKVVKCTDLLTYLRTLQAREDDAMFNK